MKIALVRRRFSPTGGAERYLERLAEVLLKRRHSVSLWCEAWAAENSVLQDIHQVKSSCPLSFSHAIKNENLFSHYDVVFSLERIEGCDIYRAGDGIHTEWLRLRASYSPIKGRISNWLRGKNWQLRYLESLTFHPEHTGYIIANSKRGKRDIIEKFGFPEERIEVIYNGIPYEKFSSGNREHGRQGLGIPHDAYVILLVGAGAERKGVRYLRAAVDKLSHLKNIYLLIIDSPPPVSMPDVYAAADVFVLPTIYDPFANVTLEAFAAGLPVITTRDCGASEVISHAKSGFILERADEIKEMARWLNLLSDPIYRQGFREASQVVAQQFTIERNVDETLALCEKAANFRHHRRELTLR